MFWNKNKENGIPDFLYINMTKVNLRASSFHGHVFLINERSVKKIAFAKHSKYFWCENDN